MPNAISTRNKETWFFVDYIEALYYYDHTNSHTCPQYLRNPKINPRSNKNQNLFELKYLLILVATCVIACHSKKYSNCVKIDIYFSSILFEMTCRDVYEIILIHSN